MTVPKSCPFCGRPSKSWHWTIEHINRDHWKVESLGDFLGEYCGKHKRFFRSGRQAMVHILEKHHNRPSASPYANTPFARNKS